MQTSIFTVKQPFWFKYPKIKPEGLEPIGVREFIVVHISNSKESDIEQSIVSYDPLTDHFSDREGRIVQGVYAWAYCLDNPCFR